jgi:phosphohistidine phosphatase
VAAFVVARMTLTVDRIVHSGKTRAQETAEIIANHLKAMEHVSSADGLDPLDDPAIWANRLTDEKKDLMLVGHLPHLDKLAAKLICGDDTRNVVSFRMGGIVCLGRDGAGNWSVRWMVTPDILK